MKINQVRETIVKHLKDSDFLTKGEFMEIPEWLQHTEVTFAAAFASFENI